MLVGGQKYECTKKKNGEIHYLMQFQKFYFREKWLEMLGKSLCELYS